MDKKTLEFDLNTPKKKDSELNLTRKLSFLLKLTFLDNYKKAKCFSEIERDLGFNSPQPDLRELLKFLEKKEVLILQDVVFGVKTYKIILRKLIDLIDDLKSTEEFYKYFYQHHIALR